MTLAQNAVDSRQIGLRGTSESSYVYDALASIALWARAFPKCEAPSSTNGRKTS